MAYYIHAYYICSIKKNMDQNEHEGPFNSTFKRH